MLSCMLAGIEHASTLARLHRQCFDAHWNAKEFTALLSSPRSFALIAQEEKNAGGFVLCRIAAEECEIITLGVLPRMRKRGIASALLHASMEKARAEHCAVIYLEVEAHNTAAKHLYESAGFIPCGTRRAYYQQADGRCADALIMKKLLQADSE